MRRARFGFAALGLLLGAAAGCDCGARVHGPADAAEEGLPEVEAPGCAELPEPPQGAVCVEAGWFAMPLWNTLRIEGGRSPCTQQPSRPVFLPAFHIDRTEVSNARWLEAVEAGAVPPPPARCGHWVWPDPTDPATAMEAVSGWREDGTVPEERLEQPVVCVSREEAAAYCAFRGGRLPTVAEWFKAGRAPWPDLRRFPWGEEPPPEPPADSWGEAVREQVLRRAHLASFNRYNAEEAPLLGEVGARPLGASAFGVEDMAGNVSEWLATCHEHIPPLNGTEPLVLRDGGPRAERCAEYEVAGGTNWRYVGGEHALALFAFRLSPRGGHAYAGIGGDPGVFCGDPSDALWPNPGYPVPDDSPPPEVARFWTVGLRCVYPSEEAR